VSFFDRLSELRPHERAVRAYFGDKAVYTGTKPVFDYPLYLLGFSNRSGSNLLASYLRSTGHFTGLGEQLNHTVVTQKAAQLGSTSFPEYFEHVSSRAKKGQAYGFKASWDQILMLIRCRIHLMYPAFRVVHIIRKDVVAQAVSFLIAHETKQWTSRQVGKEGVTPQFNFRRISAMVDGALFSQDAIAVICGLFEIPRVEVTYEELTDNPEATISRIGKFSGIDLSTWKAPPPVLSKQAQGQSAEFITRFHAEIKEKLLAPKAAQTAT
jgi:LPS sulfotransferase NodH